MIVSEFMNNLTDPTESYPVPAAISVGRATNERLEVLLAEIRGLRADLRQAAAASAPPAAPPVSKREHLPIESVRQERLRKLRKFPGRK